MRITVCSLGNSCNEEGDKGLNQFFDETDHPIDLVLYGEFLVPFSILNAKFSNPTRNVSIQRSARLYIKFYSPFSTCDLAFLRAERYASGAGNSRSEE